MGLFRPSTKAHAHCDLYCGVYDPAQAKIEAMSVWKSAQKYHDSDDEVFKARAIIIKEQQAELVKHHLSVLWTDFFTADHRSDAQPQKQRHVEQTHGRPFTTLRGDIADISLDYGHEHGRGDPMEKTDDNQGVDRI